MSAARPLELDDFGLAGKQVSGRLLASANCLEECVWPQAAADDQPSDPVGDIHKPIDNFDIGRLLEQYRAVQLSPHTRSSRSTKPEQETIEPAKLIKGNAVGSVIDGSVAPLRQTEEQLRPVTGETFRIGTPATS